MIFFAAHIMLAMCVFVCRRCSPKNFSWVVNFEQQLNKKKKRYVYAVSFIN